jgi:hypothetical protein
MLNSNASPVILIGLLYFNKYKNEKINHPCSCFSAANLIL